MKPNKWISWLKLVLLLVALLAGLWLLRSVWLGPKVVAYAVQQADLQQTLVATGRVLWPQRITLATEITGRVKQIAVSEGQQVKRGQLLLQLDDAEALAAVMQAQAVVTQAQAKLQQLHEVLLPSAQENWRQAQADVEQLSQQFKRIQKLQQQDFTSQAELDTAKRNITVANSRLQAAQLSVRSLQSRGSDLVLAEANLAQSRVSLQQAQVQLAQFQLLAPADGTLITRSIEAGDIVQPGKVLMLLAAQGDTQIEVQLDEKNLGQLVLGQKALVSADAFPDQRFDAELIYINPGIDAARGSVEIKLGVANPPDYLRQDMTVSVDIATGFRSNTLIIPAAVLQESSTNSPWVWVVRQHRVQRQSVQMGLRGDNQIEIISGLKRDDAVILANNKRIKVGQRVQVMLTAL